MRYKVLRQLLRDKDIDRQYLAEKLGYSISYVNSRFDGRQEWTMASVYTILDLLQISREKIHILFPSGGIITDDLETESKMLLIDLIAI